jgi:hypothetical protein
MKRSPSKSRLLSGLAFGGALFGAAEHMHIIWALLLTVFSNETANAIFEAFAVLVAFCAFAALDWWRGRQGHTPPVPGEGAESSTTEELLREHGPSRNSPIEARLRDRANDKRAASEIKRLRQENNDLRRLINVLLDKQGVDQSKRPQ